MILFEKLSEMGMNDNVSITQWWVFRLSSCGSQVAPEQTLQGAANEENCFLFATTNIAVDFAQILGTHCFFFSSREVTA